MQIEIANVIKYYTHRFEISIFSCVIVTELHFKMSYLKISSKFTLQHGTVIAKVNIFPFDSLLIS